MEENLRSLSNSRIYSNIMANNHIDGYQVNWINIKIDGWYKDNYNMLLFYFASLSLFVMLAFFITNNFISNNSIFGISFQKDCCQPLLLSPMASSGNNLYIVWPDNKTGNWELFFTRSVDGGHTFEIPINISNNTRSYWQMFQPILK